MFDTLVMFMKGFLKKLKLKNSADKKTTNQGSHKNSKTQFHDFSMIFLDQKCNFHDYLMHGLKPCMHFEIIKTLNHQKPEN